MKLPAFNRSVNYYNHLGVSMQASQQEIKAAYRTLAKQTHPDVVDVLREDNKTFEALHEAYQVLSDSSQKQQYDDFLRKYGRSAKPTLILRPVHSGKRKKTQEKSKTPSVFHRFIQQPLNQFFTLNFPE